jgi:transposase
VRRLEVFSGTGRRRAWSAEQKAGIVADSYERCETVSAVARRYGLTPQQLFGWRRAAQQRTDNQAGSSGLAFAPVIVDTARSCAGGPSAPGRLGGAALIEIVIGAAIIRVAPGIDGASLTTVLRAVKAAT